MSESLLELIFSILAFILSKAATILQSPQNHYQYLLKLSLWTLQSIVMYSLRTQRGKDLFFSLTSYIVISRIPPLLPLLYPF